MCPRHIHRHGTPKNGVPHKEIPLNGRSWSMLACRSTWKNNVDFVGVQPYQDLSEVCAEIGPANNQIGGAPLGKLTNDPVEEDG